MRHLRWTLVMGSTLFLFPAAQAAERMRSANALESGKIAVSVYGDRVRQKDLQFRLGGANLIQVPLQGGGTAQFFADADTDLKFEGRGSAAVVAVTWRPFTGLAYTFKAGLGDYELKVPSRTVVNTLESGPQGRLWGVEADWTLLSDTPVSPALAVSVGYDRSDYAMRRLASGGNAPVAVDQRFSLEEARFSLCLSKRWRRWEPYGGLRLFRQVSVLRDMGTAEKVSGSRNGYSPYAGLRFEFLPREALVLEVSGADEVVAAAGLSIGF